MARYETVQADQIAPEHKALYETVLAGRPKLVGPFSILMHNPPLAEAINRVNDAVRKDGTLEKRIFELIVLVAVRHLSAEYPWVVHDAIGRKEGLSGEVIDAIREKRTPTFSKPDEKAVYEAVSELLETNRMSDARYQELIRLFGLRDTIEIVACAGVYNMIGLVANTFQVPTPNGEKPF